MYFISKTNKNAVNPESRNDSTTFVSKGFPNWGEANKALSKMHDETHDNDLCVISCNVQNIQVVLQKQNEAK